MRGQTESLRLPGGDGVWDSDWNILCSRLSRSADQGLKRKSLKETSANYFHEINVLRKSASIVRVGL